MGFRTVYGRTISENGWRMCDRAECTWMQIPGSNHVTIQVRSGDAATVMVEFARRFNVEIEPLRDADTACWTETNDVASSNHLSGTAMDLNWGLHPFHAKGTYGDRLPKLRALLNDFGGCIFWGGDWRSPIDEMHFQLGFDEHDQRIIDLANKIRAAAPPPTLSRADRYALAIIAEGRRLGITPRGIKIALSVALVESNLTMYANSNDPPSLALPHDAVGSDHMSSGLFQQQTSWGTLADRMNPTASATIFFTVDHGGGVRGLTKIRRPNGDLYDYNDESHTPGFYAQTVQGSAFPDRYDERYAQASALYDRLAGQGAPPPPPQEGFLMALSDAEQHELLDGVREQRKLRASKSPFRPLGSGEDTPLWLFEMYTDGSVHVLLTQMLASLGHPDSLRILQTIAAADLAQFPDRRGDKILAQGILDNLAAPAPAPARESAFTAPEPPPPPAPAPPVYIAPIAPPPVYSPGSTGELLGRAYDALDALRLADALPIEQRAPLAALIAVLQTKNGATIS